MSENISIIATTTKTQNVERLLTFFAMRRLSTKKFQPECVNKVSSIERLS